MAKHKNIMKTKELPLNCSTFDSKNKSNIMTTTKKETSLFDALNKQREDFYFSAKDLPSTSSIDVESLLESDHAEKGHMNNGKESTGGCSHDG